MPAATLLRPASRRLRATGPWLLPRPWPPRLL
jgi:hypothetical protein